MFKIIASDLDGTLLDSKQSISEYSVNVLDKAYKKGIDFVICTGRMFDSIKFLLPKLSFCRYAITSMGAEIYDIFENKRIYFKPLENKYTMMLAEYALKNNVHMNIYIDDVLYTNSLDKYSERYFRETTTMARLIEGDVLEFLKGKLLSKLIFIGEEADIKIHLEAVKEMLEGKVNICASCKRYVEVSSIEAQKDITLNSFVKELGFNRDELIVFGDSGNDVSMLKNTGFSCTVANGWPEAMQVSNLVVESNDNDGVAKTVERLILKR
ncbi:MAG: HAD family hydrolase [Clostridia bacterium]|nr:HAD family hydrolase [Clostridia bacterium]